MSTSALDLSTSTAADARTSSLGRRLALEATIPAVMFASAAIIIGLHWDISWHRSIGRDTFWSPPHILEQVAAAVAGLFCGWRVLYTTFFGGTDADRANGVRWWGIFYGPLGGWVCIWGTIAMISSAPFDDWWHNAYGLDVEILTPPHVILLLGMIAIQLGAMLMMLAEQNREGSAAPSSRLSMLFAISMGFIVLMLATMVFSETSAPNLQHRPLFYQIFAGLFPLFLIAVARAGRGRFAATIAALTYTAIIMTLNWVLPLVPAQPMLAPIYNPITHLVPPGPPTLLIVPALLIDLLVSSRRVGGDWTRAVLAGIGFVAVLFAVQWPMASLLMSLPQPNYLTGFGFWEYNVRPGSWQTEFWGVPGRSFQRGVGWTGSVDWSRVLQGLAFAMVLGVASSRVGLWWGGWMAKVRR